MQSGQISSEALEGFAHCLYAKAFSALVALTNRSISSTARTIRKNSQFEFLKIKEISI
jgi:hypothetical protein